MGQQFQQRRPANSERSWLSALIEAMEAVARPELRRQPADRLVLAAVRAQLSRPASSPQHGSRFSLHN